MNMKLHCTIAEAQLIYSAYNALAKYELSCASVIAFNLAKMFDVLSDIERQRIEILSKDCRLDDSGSPLGQIYDLESNVPLDHIWPTTIDMCQELVEDGQYVGFAFNSEEVRQRNDEKVRELLSDIHDFGAIEVISQHELNGVSMPAEILFPLIRNQLITE